MLPPAIKTKKTLHNFKKYQRLHFHKSPPILTTSQLILTRQQEIVLNKVRADLFFRAQFYAHNFQSIQTPNCNCGKPQTLKHFLCQCDLLSIQRQELNDKLANLEPKIFNGNLSQTDLINILKTGIPRLNLDLNSKIITLIVKATLSRTIANSLLHSHLRYRIISSRMLHSGSLLDLPLLPSTYP